LPNIAEVSRRQQTYLILRGSLIRAGSASGSKPQFIVAGLAQTASKSIVETTTRTSPRQPAALSEMPSSTSDVLLYFLAIFLPPLAVFFKRGCAADFWINVLLSILGWLPGVIHAWYVISKYERPEAVVVAPAGQYA